MPPYFTLSSFLVVTSTWKFSFDQVQYLPVMCSFCAGCMKKRASRALLVKLEGYLPNKKRGVLQCWKTVCIAQTQIYIYRKRYYSLNCSFECFVFHRHLHWFKVCFILSIAVMRATWSHGLYCFVKLLFSKGFLECLMDWETIAIMKGVINEFTLKSKS